MCIRTRPILTEKHLMKEDLKPIHQSILSLVKHETFQAMLLYRPSNIHTIQKSQLTVIDTTARKSQDSQVNQTRKTQTIVFHIGLKRIYHH